MAKPHSATAFKHKNNHVPETNSGQTEKRGMEKPQLHTTETRHNKFCLFVRCWLLWSAGIHFFSPLGALPFSPTMYSVHCTLYTCSIVQLYDACSEQNGSHGHAMFIVLCYVFVNNIMICTIPSLLFILDIETHSHTHTERRKQEQRSNAIIMLSVVHSRKPAGLSSFLHSTHITHENSRMFVNFRLAWFSLFFFL